MGVHIFEARGVRKSLTRNAPEVPKNVPFLTISILVESIIRPP